MKATLRIIAMVTALILVAGSGVIIGIAHEKKVRTNLWKEIKFQSDVLAFGMYCHYSDALLAGGSSDYQEALVLTRTNLTYSLKALKKLPQNHFYAKYRESKIAVIQKHVQDIDHKIAEQADTSSGDNPPN